MGFTDWLKTSSKQIKRPIPETWIHGIDTPTITWANPSKGPIQGKGGMSLEDIKNNNGKILGPLVDINKVMESRQPKVGEDNIIPKNDEIVAKLRAKKIQQTSEQIFPKNIGTI
jgi:hypothetical protein